MLKVDDTTIRLVVDFEDARSGAGPAIALSCNHCNAWIWRFGNRQRRPMTTTLAWLVAAVNNHLCEETHDGDVGPDTAR